MRQYKQLAVVICSCLAYFLAAFEFIHKVCLWTYPCRVWSLKWTRHWQLPSLFHSQLLWFPEATNSYFLSIFFFMMGTDLKYLWCGELINESVSVLILASLIPIYFGHKFHHIMRPSILLFWYLGEFYHLNARWFIIRILLGWSLAWKEAMGSIAVHCFCLNNCLKLSKDQFDYFKNRVVGSFFGSTCSLLALIPLRLPTYPSLLSGWVGWIDSKFESQLKFFLKLGLAFQ